MALHIRSGPFNRHSRGACPRDGGERESTILGNRALALRLTPIASTDPPDALPFPVREPIRAAGEAERPEDLRMTVAGTVATLTGTQ